MVDDTTLNPGVGGDVYRSIDIGGKKHQVIIPSSGDGVLYSATNPLPVRGLLVTRSVDVIRPSADGTAYNINDAMSNSTTAPTAGGFIIPNAARVSGGSGEIRGLTFITSAVQATPPSLEVVIFDTAVTNINDNAIFAVSDAEAKTFVDTIPVTAEAFGNNQVGVTRNISNSVHDRRQRQLDLPDSHEKRLHAAERDPG